MNILVLQETDWLTRGPHTQHHIFERMSKNPKIKITVLDYDIDKTMRSKSILIKKQIFNKTDRAITGSNVTVIRTAHIQVPYFRRISSLITNSFEMLNLFKKDRPDIIVAFSLTNGLIGLILSKLYGIPFVFYYIDMLHTLISLEYIKKVAQLFSRLLFKKSDKNIVVTKSLQKYALNQGVKEMYVQVLLNGISLENTVVDQKKLQLLKNKYLINDDNFVLFFMGYLYDFAGLKEIIDYYNKDVRSGKLKFKFFIIGDGGIYDSLVKYVKDIGANWVILTGRLAFFEITEFIELADLCLMSFDLNEITREITPVKIMEYMAMKKPVLSNSLPGVIKEIGRNNGVIFSKNQVDLIQKIESLSKDKEKLKKIGEVGFSLIKKYYVWPKILNKFRSILLDLIKKNRIK
ncbi:MAG: glycosyltransferase [Promethearchaeota archaeon]